MITGYAAVFNRDSSDMGFIEQVDPAAFDKTIREADVRGLANHDQNWLLGRTKAGTMRVAKDTVGLRYEIDVNTADPDGQRALAKVQRGDWDGSSFSFATISDQWNWSTTPPQRRLTEVRLVDVGPVTYPAYPDATAEARALAPIAGKLGRPVEELVTALRTGEIRSLLGDEKPDEGRALSPVAGTVMWGGEDGFCDLLSDVNAELMGVDTGMSAMDVSVKLDKVLICDWAGGVYYVAGITVDEMGEPHLDPQDQWVPVEQGWLVDDDAGRVFAIAAEMRAGKMLSKANADVLQGIADQLRDLLKQALGESPEESEIGPPVADKGEDERSVDLLAADIEIRRRVALAEQEAA
jgi:HK97 family phage prohead protease